MDESITEPFFKRPARCGLKFSNPFVDKASLHTFSLSPSRRRLKAPPRLGHESSLEDSPTIALDPKHSKRMRHPNSQSEILEVPALPPIPGRMRFPHD